MGEEGGDGEDRLVGGCGFSSTVDFEAELVIMVLLVLPVVVLDSSRRSFSGEEGGEGVGDRDLSRLAEGSVGGLNGSSDSGTLVVIEEGAILFNPWKINLQNPASTNSKTR